MYNYKYDKETGGLLLTTEKCGLSNEPRPVYSDELDLLGFNKYYKYSKRKEPYMWAQAQYYYYRDEKPIAKLKGGNLDNKPEIEILKPELNGIRLNSVDIISMCEKNKPYITGLVQTTKQRLFETYKKYKNKIDIFYVAFSGGKDSIVTLDIVKKTLPNSDFCVVFGDTGMEFPDTYDVIDKVEEECKKDNIRFYRAKSHLNPEDTWKIFGPPATTQRWCCSVHKTTPQILKLREITGKPDFIGMAFTGVRGDESIKRSQYQYECHGEKHKGQDSCNVVLDWNSAELWIYIYINNLLINETYKKGNSRAGCLVCPNVSEKSEYIRCNNYSNNVEIYYSIIKDFYKNKCPNEILMDEFLIKQGWTSRVNGNDLNQEIKFKEEKNNTKIKLIITNASTNWKEWIKTIGNCYEEGNNNYKLNYKGEIIDFEVIGDDKNYNVILDESLSKTNPSFVKMFKQVFRKAAYCIKCGECQADCCLGNIDFSKEHFISDSCISCGNCHKAKDGCLLYYSLREPTIDDTTKKNSFEKIRVYSTHAPLISWFEQLFLYKEDFFRLKSKDKEFVSKYGLGSEMIANFQRFLKHSGIYDEENNITDLGNILFKLGLKNPVTWGIMLSNLVYTPLFNWYINNIKINKTFERKYISDLLQLHESVKNERTANDIISCFKRILILPFGDLLGLGSVKITEPNKIGNTSLISLTRHTWKEPDERVILYSLYKYAEKNDIYTIKVSQLFDETLDCEGISPVKIFGLSRETLIPVLNAMSINYSNFVNVTFTHDMEHIVLYEEKKDNILDILRG